MTNDRQMFLPLVALALAALVVAACGSSGGHPASAPPTTTTVPAVPMPACPGQPGYPESRGPAGTRLIELEATRLRVCFYATARGGSVLSAHGDAGDPAAVTALERTGNAFRYPAVQNFMCPLILERNSRTLIAMFANSTGVVSVLVRDRQCPAYGATNGHGAAFTSKAWFDALLAVANNG